MKPCQCNEQETKRNFGHGPGEFTSSTHWETKARIRYINLPFQMKNMVEGDMTLCISEDKYDCFGVTCCLYHQCKRHLKQAIYIYIYIYISNFWKWDTRIVQFYLFCITHFFFQTADRFARGINPLRHRTRWVAHWGSSTALRQSL